MNERELLYVKMVAETKSISKAAKKLFIAQPSLSQAIQKIEEEIGTKLFIRKREGIALTLAGERYYITATKILNIYNDFKNEIADINDLKLGRITIGITDFMATYLLPRLLPQFIESYPNIEVFLKEENSTILEQSIINGSIDFAIMHNHALCTNKSISHYVLFKDPFLLVTKKDHPISKFMKKVDNYRYPFMDINKIKNEKFILSDKDKRIRQVCDIIFNSAGINPNISLTVKSFETARRLASISNDITLIPLHYIQIFEGLYDADYYFIENNEHAYWDTCIATNQNMYLSKAAKAFIDSIHFYFNTQQPI